MENLIVSSSPHMLGGDSTRRIMLDVIFALSPATVVGIMLFGWRAALLIAVCVGAAVLSEYICRRVMRRPQTIGDLSAVVTGLLLALNLPVGLPVWMGALGSAVAVVVIKQMFGGIGQNFVNPAIAARIVLLMSFGAAMTSWTAPFAWLSGSDAVTVATPLASGEMPTYMNMLLGLRAGCIGETCALALLIGGIYLCVRHVITPVIPVFFVGTTALLMWAFGSDPLAQIMSGGLLLGAIFMATDYVTSPCTVKGQIIYAVGCGLITALIRQFGNLPEGVSFSIILMNILTPHIDNLVTTRPFGALREPKPHK